MADEKTHPTRIQRAETQQSESRDQRRIGHEPSDAPPRRVLLGMAMFVLLLFAGLAGAAADLSLLGSTLTQPSPDGPAPFATTAPRLLAEPAAARGRLEAAQRARIDPADMRLARQRLIERGWPVPGPAPAAREAARNHAETRP